MEDAVPGRIEDRVRILEEPTHPPCRARKELELAVGAIARSARRLIEQVTAFGAEATR